MEFLTILFTLLICYSESASTKNDMTTGDDEPVYLTPLINEGKIEEAQNKALVTLPNNKGFKENYSGLFTVSDEYKSFHHLWYCKNMSDYKYPSTLLWLPSMPGRSVMQDMFEGNGLFRINETDGYVIKNPHKKWPDFFHMVYIDCMFGSGYSYTTDPAGYPTDTMQVAEQVYSTLKQFYKMFPKILPNSTLYVGGERYGAKLAAAVQYTINKNKDKDGLNVTLAGLILDSPWLEPVNQMNFHDSLYETGFLDEVCRDQATLKEKEIVDLLQQEQYSKAYDAYWAYKHFLAGVTGKIYFDNYLNNEPVGLPLYVKELQTNATLKNVIHMGNLPFVYFSNLEDYKHLQEDYMMSGMSWINEILQKYPIVFRAGQVSAEVPYMGVYNVVSELPSFKGYKRYECVKDSANQESFFYSNMTNIHLFLVKGAGDRITYDRTNDSAASVNFIIRGTYKTDHNYDCTQVYPMLGGDDRYTRED